jgi:NAD(P)-dependent dehydrogenase (short-subunit alcohol dehydrogenase family)
MSVNAFGHFLAINQLYPLLRKTSKIANAPAPRIVFESSEMHRFAPSNVHFGSLEEINDETIDPTQLYGRTKVSSLFSSFSPTTQIDRACFRHQLAMICYTKAILEKVIKPNNDNIYILAVHPGAVNTEMQEQWTQVRTFLLLSACGSFC